MVYLESYSHKLSKQVIKDWIINPLLECNNFFNEFEFYNSNRIDSVLYEYGIYKRNNIDSVVYDWSSLLGDGCATYNPSFQELAKQGIYCPSVVDMVLLNDNKPYLFIEIKKTHPVSKKKIDLLKTMGVKNLIEIEAEYVMNQCSKPHNLQYVRLI